MIKNNVFIVGLLVCMTMRPVSVVYNMRILQTSKQRALQFAGDRPSIASLGLVNQWRERRTLNFHESFTALLGSYIYLAAPFYLRADFAFGHVASKVKDVNFSRNQTDDIYLAAGYSMPATERSTITASVIMGVPTHQDTALQGIQFGTGHMAFGGQLDGVFKLDSETPQSMLAAARYLYFVPRIAHTNITGQYRQFLVDIGDIVDLFVAYQVSLGTHKNHRLMLGYNPSFLYGAQLCPAVPALNGVTTAIRSSFFSSYIYFFKIKSHMSGLLIGLSSGFDHIPKKLGIKNQTTAWVGWGINF